MDIRHKSDTLRIVSDVQVENRGAYYFKIEDDVIMQYPMKTWEDASLDQWERVEPTVGHEGKSLLYKNSHVAVVLNRNDFRFVEAMPGDWWLEQKK